ncbi:MAG: exonuclease SbcD [Chlamydiales bacterium]|jgi:exonuclease SbcD
MKILHTADWHIGRSLYGQKRYAEFEAFLEWLAKAIVEENIDALLLAGDVFDNSAPSNRSQGLYYRFLCKIAGSSCRHVVVTSGNHDSPTFLNAPKELLRSLNVHVVGTVPENIEDELIVLEDDEGNAELIVCAVPYLRDRDLRVAESGESLEDKDKKLVEGIRNHYHTVGDKAEKIKSELKRDIPIVAMGHLFAAGGKTVDGDGVRELYIGSLAHVGADIFPACIDYLALGHLHVPQVLSNNEWMRYSGSPIPMGFGEATQEKSVCVVSFTNPSLSIELLKVPVFQKLAKVRGNWDEIFASLTELSLSNSDAWVEVVYEGKEAMGDLRELLDEAISETEIKILRVKNKQVIDRVLNSIEVEETLDDLNVNDVFIRCLDAHEIPEEQRAELLNAYQETVTTLQEMDKKAE